MKRLACILPLCLVSLACSTLQRPTATFKSMNVQDITAQGFTMNFAVDLKNPNSVALPLSNADYKIALGGVQVLEGKAKPEGSIPAGGSTGINLPVTLTYQNLFAAEEALRKGGGDVPYALDGGLDVGSGSPLLGQSVRVPLQYSGTLELKKLLQNPQVLLSSPTARKLAEQVLGGLFGH